MTAWMVRAGLKGHLFDRFIDDGIATVGWTEVGEVSTDETVETLREKFSKIWPSWHPNKIIMGAGQLYRFARVIQPGDMIVTYDPSRRIYKIGTAHGSYRLDVNFDSSDGGQIMDVGWHGDVPRDALRSRTKNSLGAISTLFKIPDHAQADLERVLAGYPDDAVLSEPASEDE
ncbi:hypothetical protein [uncultured Algimonas sp.]|uniref:restriction endonuclease n=1 Tax=uncultured Algimonas sp. TaxID=1547920 RepID=UPI00260BC475|nr:hypothetical protein [uncultured Algimonas sp.]